MKAYWQGAKRSEIQMEISILRACDHVKLFPEDCKLSFWIVEHFLSNLVLEELVEGRTRFSTQASFISLWAEVDASAPYSNVKPRNITHLYNYFEDSASISIVQFSDLINSSAWQNPVMRSKHNNICHVWLVLSNLQVVFHWDQLCCYLGINGPSDLKETRSHMNLGSLNCLEIGLGFCFACCFPFRRLKTPWGPRVLWWRRPRWQTERKRQDVATKSWSTVVQDGRISTGSFDVALCDTNPMENRMEGAWRTSLSIDAPDLFCDSPPARERYLQLDAALWLRLNHYLILFDSLCPVTVQTPSPKSELRDIPIAVTAMHHPILLCREASLQNALE